MIEIKSEGKFAFSQLKNQEMLLGIKAQSLGLRCGLSCAPEKIRWGLNLWYLQFGNCLSDVIKMVHWGEPQSKVAGILLRRDRKENAMWRQTHRMKTVMWRQRQSLECHKSKNTWGYQKLEEARMNPALPVEAPQWAWPRQHLGFRLLSSRAVREEISTVSYCWVYVTLLWQL